MITNTETLPSLNVGTLKRLHRDLLRIRLIEERIVELYPQQEMRCPVHLSIGQEAVPVGVCAHLATNDYVMSNHRSHGHYLAKGGSLKAMLAEFYGRATGCTSGRGGSMHLLDLEAGFLGAVPIVGATIPMTVGAAWGSRMKGESRVVVAFFGEAATEEGVFHEAINFAAVKRLPVVFVCENNLYSVYSPLGVRQPATRETWEVAKGHGVPAAKGDGNNPVEIYQMAGEALARARAGGGPSFLEFETYRWREHCGPYFDNTLGYRTEAEFELWKQRCPVTNFTAQMREWGLLTQQELDALTREITAEIDEAVAFAKASPFPDASQMATFTYAELPQEDIPPRMARELKYAEAIHEATDLCMAKDPRVHIFGLGVPDPKGIFGTTAGLQEKYGDERVSDAPTSENGLTGVAIGSAIVGMRPILTHQRLDFAVLTMEQLVNQAAKWHYMFGGRMRVPLVVRMLLGRGWGQGPQHSQSLQAWFAHVPGLKVVMPTTPHDVKGLLISAIEDDNPVIFIEHRWLYNISGPVPEGVYRVPIGEARVVRPGADITIVSISYMTLEALRAADVLAHHGISAEVIDLRSLRPWDSARVLESVGKTGRLLVTDTGWKIGGFAGEIVATVCEAGVPLKTPPRRVCLPDSPSPTSPALAAPYFPRAVDLERAVADMFGVDLPETHEPVTIPLDIPDASFTGPF